MYTVGISALMTVYWFTARNELSWGMVLFQGLWLILIVEGSVAINEKTEKKTQGYSFLRLLPIQDREIVISKFILVLVTGIVVLVYNNFLYLFIPGPSYLHALGRTYLFICLFIALIFAGLSYIIIFRFGHAVFVKFVWITLITTMVTPILIVEFVLLKMEIDLPAFIDRMSQFTLLIWITAALCGFSIYFFLMQLAIKAKQASRR
jgi:hypothetical protein